MFQVGTAGGSAGSAVLIMIDGELSPSQAVSLLEYRNAAGLRPRQRSQIIASGLGPSQPEALTVRSVPVVPRAFQPPAGGGALAR